MSIPADSPILQRVNEQWRKLCATVMHKQGITDIEISHDDIAAMEADPAAGTVALESYPDKVRLRWMPAVEAERAARASAPTDETGT